MDEEAKKKLVGKRGGHKAYATKIANDAAKLCKEVNPDHRPTLHAYLKTLSDRKDVIVALDDEILGLMNPDDMVEEVMTSGEYQTNLELAIFNITDALERMKDKDETETKKDMPPLEDDEKDSAMKSSPKIETKIESKGSSGSTTIQHAKLPRLQLKHFSGDRLMFQEFWESFESAVHNDKAIDDIMKFNYLRSVLDDEAASVISGLSLTSKNYKEAVTLLRDRYENKQILVSGHIDQLLNLPTVTSSTDTSMLRELYDSVEKNVRCLKNLDISSSHYGPILLQIVMRKIPNDIQLVISRAMASVSTGTDDTDTWKIDELLKSFKQEIESREMCRFIGTTDSPGSISSLHTGVNNQDRRDDSNRPTPAQVCVFCDKKHASWKCNTVTDVPARKVILRQRGRCFICLETGHISRYCKSKYKCVKCKGRHNVGLCEPRPPPPEEPPPAEANVAVQLSDHEDQSDHEELIEATTTDSTDAVDAETTGVVEVLSNVVASKRTITFLMTARALIGNIALGREVNVRMLFDNCAQKSFITEQVQKFLKLPCVRKEPMIINAFGGGSKVVKEYVVVRGCVLSLDGKKLGLVDFNVVPEICQPISDQKIELAQATYEHLKGLELSDKTDGNDKLAVDVLIGANFYWDYVMHEVIDGLKGPVAIKTRVGWVLSGSMPDGSEQAVSMCAQNLSTVMHLGVDSMERRMDEQLKRFWMLDGIEVNETSSVDFVSKFKNDIEFKNGRYYVDLPRRDNADSVVLPDNYHLSKARLISLYKKMKEKNPDTLRRIDEVFKQQKETGIIEDAGDEPVELGNVHYLPHAPIVRDDRDTTKLREVFDGSAKVKDGICINDDLETGPNMLPKILDIIVRSRCYKFLLVSDIKSAFHQIFLKESSRDLTRFLWFDDINSKNPIIVKMRHCVVLFGLSPSPFILCSTVSNHMEQYIESHEEIVRKFLRDIYMDDSITGAQTKAATFEFYKHVKELMLKGGFELRKWVCNDEEVQKKILQSEQEVYNIADCIQKTDMKVLGMSFKPKEDNYIFSIEKVVIDALNFDGPITKRHIVSVTARYYDPVGILSPITIRFKFLIQEACMLKLAWDDDVGEELRKKWRQLLLDCADFQPIVMKRNYLGDWNLSDVSDIQLHGFADASGKAYASVVYLRFTLNNGEIITAFVSSKTKVAPIKKITLPRLELMGCVILVALIRVVLHAFTDYVVSKTYCWTDNTDCLSWIVRRDKLRCKFVQNRANKIREHLPDVPDNDSNLPPTVWMHCPGKINPADIPSRGLSLADNERREVWTHGPAFLKQPSDYWPKQQDIHHSTNDDDDPDSNDSVAVNVITTDVSVAEIIDKDSFNSFQKLINVTSYVLRFIDNCKRARKNEQLVLGELSSIERDHAKIMWFRNEQSVISEKYFKQLQYNLGAYVDEDGVIKLKGRLEHSDLNVSAKFPVLIPKQSGIGDLIIHDAHAKVLHYGRKDTLTEVRSEYWLIQGRSRVTSFVYRCRLCRKFDGKLLKKLPAAPLPDFRVQCCDPFTNVGVDYLGPIHVYPTPSNTRTSSGKVHVVLYTCANTRMVHLDLVPDASCYAFINSLKRFIGRRTAPSLFISDNAKCFIGKELKSYLCAKGIDWKHILEVSPWWGGFYERLVKTVKRSLRKILRRTTVTYDELLTIIIEIEAVMNSRPLCYQYSDEVDEVLTPSHMDKGKRLLSSRKSLPTAVHDETPTSLKNRVDYLNSLLTHYENRWKKEYLTELREFQRNNNRIPDKQVRVGDVVLISDENLPRTRWRLGKVEELRTSSDGFVRGCKLRVHNEGRRVSYLNRPVNKLCYFEVSSADTVN